MSVPTKIFAAKRIITMCPEEPFATAVAVKDGRILAVGGVNDVVYWIKNSPFGPYEVDTVLKDKVLMPGLVDPHTHLDLQALIYSGHFVSQIPWPRPEGGFYPIYPTKADVLNHLKELDKELPPGELLYGAAYDENKAGGFLHMDELDAVSTRRPILISNLVFHRFWINRFLLQKAGIRVDSIPPNVQKDADGKPNGTLIETKGLISVLPAVPNLVDITAQKISSILPLFYKGGNTTVCEAGLGALGMRKAMGLYQNFFPQSEVKLRVVGLPWWSMGIAEAGSLDKFINWYKNTKAESIDKFRLGAVKLYIDGSIISRTTPIGWPGYWDGSTEGRMAQDPEEIKALIIRLHGEGISTVTHTNTAAGFQVVLEAVKEAQTRCYRADLRHRAEHCYTITEAQLRLARELGVGVSFYSTQIYYYGDSHLKLQGLNRAHHITPIGIAKRLGVSWTFHNDPPGAPQLPWIAAWTAVQRQTMESGTILGPGQRMKVEDVLRAMTIEAAYQLHLDHEIGSIEFGKKADFCVLEADPLEIDPKELKDIPVWGTVFGGRLNPIGNAN